MTPNTPHNPPPEPQAERWQELMAGYVLGDLSPDELAEVQQYLASHPRANDEVAELQATLHLLPLSLPEGAAPPEMLQVKLLDSALATPQQAPQIDTAIAPNLSVPSRKRWRSPITWAAIAATLAAAILGFQNLQLRNELQLAQQQSERLAAIEAQLVAAKADVANYQQVIGMLRQPKNRLFSLSGTSGFTPTSSGSVVIAPQQNWAMLTLKDMPEPPAGKAYQLWAIVNDEKVYCIEFKPDATGQVLVEIPVGNWAGTPMLSITLEDEGTIPTETSEMVMNGIVI